MAIALKRSRKFAFAALALWQVVPPAVAQPAPDAVRYTVRAGDNLFRLAANYLIRRDDYRVVQRLNHVADPLRLPVGMVLLLPRDLLRYEPVAGTVFTATGLVRIDGRAAAPGMAVGEGMLLETGQRSFLTLALPDRTNITLPSQTALRIRRLRRIVLDAHVERLFAIEHGQASATVTPMTDPRSTFQFATPGAITSVRGTHFRMAYDPTGARSTSEVTKGAVGFASNARPPQSLPEGFGTASDLDAPVELLPPPALIAGDAPQTGAQPHFAWAPVPGASGYHVEIARDAGLLNPVDELRTADPQAWFAALDDGAWFVSVTAIDAHGIEGRAATAGFVRQRLNELRLSVTSDRYGQWLRYTFHWDPRDEDPGLRFRFQLARAGREDHPVTDQADLSARTAEGIALPRGAWRWRVRMTQVVGGVPQEQWSPWQDLMVASEE